MYILCHVIVFVCYFSFIFLSLIDLQIWINSYQLILELGLGGNDGWRWRKGVRNQRVWLHRFWILDNVDWELYIWEEITSTTLGELPDDMEDTDWQLLNRQVWGLFDLPCQDQHNIVKEKTTSNAPCCLLTALHTDQTKVHLMWFVWRAVGKQQGASDVAFSFTMLCAVDLDRVNRITPKHVYQELANMHLSYHLVAPPKVVDVISSHTNNP